MSMFLLLFFKVDSASEHCLLSPFSNLLKTSWNVRFDRRPLLMSFSLMFCGPAKKMSFCKKKTNFLLFGCLVFETQSTQRVRIKDLPSAAHTSTYVQIPSAQQLIWFFQLMLLLVSLRLAQKGIAMVFHLFVDLICTPVRTVLVVLPQTRLQKLLGLCWNSCAQLIVASWKCRFLDVLLVREPRRLPALKHRLSQSVLCPGRRVARFVLIRVLVWYSESTCCFSVSTENCCSKFHWVGAFYWQSS